MRIPDITSTKVIVPSLLFALLSTQITGMGGWVDRLGMTSVFGILYIIITRGMARYVVRTSEVILACSLYMVLGGMVKTQVEMIQYTFLYWILFALIRSQSPLDF